MASRGSLINLTAASVGARELRVALVGDEKPRDLGSSHFAYKTFEPVRGSPHMA